MFSAAGREAPRDEAIVALEFADGSAGTLVYTGGGSPAAGKERIEVFAGGATFVVEDGHGEHGGAGIHEAPLLCVLPPVATALGGIVLFFYAEEIWLLLMGMVP